MVLLLSTLIIVIMSIALTAFGQMHTETLLNACKEKTQIMKLIQGKPEVVGEEIAGLCHGYLIGVYDALVKSKVICAPSDLPTPEYLYSVLQTYLKVEPSSSAKPAVEVTQAAYQRAFSCEEKRK